MQLIGDGAVVSAIQRFNLGNGAFETAAYRDGTRVGINFLIEHGVGYLIHMHSDQSDIVLP